MLLTSSLGKRGTHIPLAQAQNESCLQDGGEGKSEELASAWLMLMGQNLNSYLSPGFLLESRNLKDFLFTISKTEGEDGAS